MSEPLCETFPSVYRQDVGRGIDVSHLTKAGATVREEEVRLLGNKDHAVILMQLKQARAFACVMPDLKNPE